ncbi:type II restriction endonuclease [Enterococcus hirae]|uniref:restriction endonuclease subunit S n=1 Tax=Enterococcus hirae TaxID=1354 RepID=UPI000BBCC046|nr:restriction endonuclease subunit S [Enterococcus hirae]PCE02580.1 type II restriction endonuclease [Enterococcus hirae]
MKNTRNILSRDIVFNSGKIPYLTASSSNNSVGTYISYNKELLEEGNSIFIGGKTLVVTYQPEDYFSNDSHNLALYYKDSSKRTKIHQIFFATSIYKSLSHLYSWGDSISSRKIQKDTFLLPTNQSGEIDYKFIEMLISAIQKIVIKDVVDWADKKIKATRSLVDL